MLEVALVLFLILLGFLDASPIQNFLVDRHELETNITPHGDLLAGLQFFVIVTYIEFCFHDPRQDFDRQGNLLCLVILIVELRHRVDDVLHF